MGDKDVQVISDTIIVCTLFVCCTYISSKVIESRGSYNEPRLPEGSRRDSVAAQAVDWVRGGDKEGKIA